MASFMLGDHSKRFSGHELFKLLVFDGFEVRHFPFFDQPQISLSDVDSEVEEDACDFDAFLKHRVDGFFDLVEIKQSDVQVLLGIAVGHLVKSFNTWPNLLDAL